MIPSFVTVTYCRTCEHSILTGGLCLAGCRWDASTSRERPVVLVTYWRRDAPTAHERRDPESPGRNPADRASAARTPRESDRRRAGD